MFTVLAMQPRLRGVTLPSRFVYGPAWSAIGASIDNADAQAEPFIWTSAVNVTMANIEKCNAIDETLH